MATGFYRTAGGTVLELDAPAAGTHAAERFAEQLAKGELVPLDSDAVEKVTAVYGADKNGKELSGFTWVLKAPPASAAAPAPKPAPAPADGSIEAILTAVRGGPDGTPPTEGWQARARAAMSAETAKGAKARKTVIDRLEAALAAASTTGA